MRDHIYGWDTAFVLVGQRSATSIVIRLPNIGLVMFETDFLNTVDDLVFAVSRELGGSAHSINILSSGMLQNTR